MSGFVITFIPREQQKSEYDWVNLIFNDSNVGKARCLINGYNFTVFSINIYPEHKGKGFGKAFIEVVKNKYKIITADRVRNMAIGFWENVGFVKDGESGNWIFINGAT
jgi:GNAT superfamily N-acetyltransferase